MLFSGLLLLFFFLLLALCMKEGEATRSRFVLLLSASC